MKQMTLQKVVEILIGIALGVLLSHVVTAVQVKLAGYDAKITELSLSQQGSPNQLNALSGQSLTLAAGSEVAGTIKVKNTGSQPWAKDVNYYALGIYCRPWQRCFRTSKPAFLIASPVTDRVIVPESGIAAGTTWKQTFRFRVPLQQKGYTLYFRMVHEKRAWFGASRKIRIQAVQGSWAPAAMLPAPSLC